jgi:hypothetical protein
MSHRVTEVQIQNMLRIIQSCDDPRQLVAVAANAKKQNVLEVQHAALLRLYAVKPSQAPGTIEYEVWQSVFALEGALKEERGKTVLLSRTRQKIKRDGEMKTIADLVLGKKPSEGFTMLFERNMSKLAFEVIALRHPTQFNETVRAAATRRLHEAGLDPCQLI